jgi:sporulation protein YlmC with PRC-barrel domain
MLTNYGSDYDRLLLQVGCEVVTERGTFLGKIRDFEFEPDSGIVTSIVFDGLGLPLVPSSLVCAFASSELCIV